ncbi:hypothetical protein GCM10020229_13460 [Kitasatospora albolonga]|uniref:DUF6188 family protein n=1 Tax=Kitasatospora albolonga TaxID=68173 RepID=UPI0031F0FD80
MTESIAEALTGRRVERVRGGGQVRLDLDDGLTVLVDSDFRLRTPGGVEHFYPHLGADVAGGLAELAGARVTDTTVTPAGGLELAFDCGRRLSVPADTVHRPWQVSGPAGPLFTAEPGGYLTG